MKQKKLFTALAVWLLIASLSLGVVGCKNSDDDNGGGNEESFVTSIDLTSAKSLSLAAYSYEVSCSAPDNNGESWTAKLSFDDEDVITDDEVFLGDFAYIFPTKGTGSGSITLCVLDPTDESSRTGKLTVTYAGGSTIEIALEQRASASNALEGGASGRKKRAIGYGYNAFKGYASEQCLVNPVFRIAQMEDEEGIETEDGDIAQIVYADSASRVTYREESGSNIAELEKNLNASVSASTEFAGFSAELEASYSQSQKQNDDYQFAWLDTLVTTHTASVEGDVEALAGEEVLTAGAYKAINNTNGNWDDFQKVVQNYGTHVVVGGKLGGKLHVDMAADTSKITGSYEASAMIKAGYSNAFVDASAQVDADYKNTFTNERSAFTFTSSVRGGSSGTDGTQAQINDLLTSRETDAAITSEWQKSLSEITNCVFMDFDSFDDDLLPIYELVDRELPNGEERYEEFKEYFTGKMLTDFTVPKQSSYVSSAPAKITIPTEEEWTREERILRGSLVRDVYNGGTLVARITNEFIPQLNAKKRVTVVYPATNTKVYYNMGYFVGDETHRPHSVSWNGSVPVLTEKNKEAFGAVSCIYIKSLNMSAQEPDYLASGVSPFETTQTDYTLNAGANGTYTVVKVLNNLYTRTFWNGTVSRNGTHLADNTHYYSRRSDGLKYYSKEAYISLESRYGAFTPENWEVPDEDRIKTLLSVLTGIQGSPDSDLQQAFNTRGVLGLRLDCIGYTTCYYRTNNQPEAFWSYTHGYGYTYVGVVNKPGTDYNQNRLVLGYGQAAYSDVTLAQGYETGGLFYLPLILCQSCN